MMWLYKDCSEDCPHSACNQKMDGVLNEFDTGLNQESCYACSYVEQEGDIVVGNKNCLDNAEELPNGSTECPVYANAGCYTGSNTHKVGKCFIFIFKLYF